MANLHLPGSPQALTLPAPLLPQAPRVTEEMLALGMAPRLLAAARQPSIQRHVSNSTGEAVFTAGTAMLAAWAYVQDVAARKQLWDSTQTALTDDLLDAAAEHGSRAVQHMSAVRQRMLSSSGDPPSEDEALLAHTYYEQFALWRFLGKHASTPQTVQRLARSRAYAAFAVDSLTFLPLGSEAVGILLRQLEALVSPGRGITAAQRAALVPPRMAEHLVRLLVEDATCELVRTLSRQGVPQDLGVEYLGMEAAEESLALDLNGLNALLRVVQMVAGHRHLQQAVAQGERATAVLQLLQAAERPGVQTPLVLLLSPSYSYRDKLGDAAVAQDEAPASAVARQVVTFPAVLPLLLHLADPEPSMAAASGAAEAILYDGLGVQRRLAAMRLLRLLGKQLAAPAQQEAVLRLAGAPFEGPTGVLDSTVTLLEPTARWGLPAHAGMLACAVCLWVWCSQLVCD